MCRHTHREREGEGAIRIMMKNKPARTHTHKLTFPQAHMYSHMERDKHTEEPKSW